MTKNRIEEAVPEAIFRHDDLNSIGATVASSEKSLATLLSRDIKYDEAINLGVLPSFRIVHYGLRLNGPERERYERLSRQITDLRETLETRNAGA